jgi:hypothetical protein
MKRLILLGVILIVVGLAIFALNLQGIGLRLLRPGPLFLGAIGGAFLGGYAYTRWYGFLIPGCILASLWLSITLAGLLPPRPGDLEGAIIVGGLGVSFFAICLVDRFYGGRRRIWLLWLLIPGLVLLVIGGLLGLTGLGMELTVEQWQILGNMVLPLGLIALGVWLVLRWALRARGGARDIAPRQES